MKDKNKYIYSIILIVLVGYGFYWFREYGPGYIGSSNIEELEIMSHIRFLSDDERAGRYPGSRESKDVISYITKQFKRYKIEPGASRSRFIQPFTIVDSMSLGDKNYFYFNSDSLQLKKDFIPLWFSGSGALKTEVAFAGYGFSINQDSLIWNDYKNIKVQNKWVMVMRHSPERGNPHSVYAPHSDLHKKMMVARDQGAAGIIYISQHQDSTLLELNYIPGYSQSGIPAIHISNAKANEILSFSAQSVKQIQKKMDSNLKSVSFNIPDVNISAKIELKSIRTKAGNIIGKITSRNHKYRDEYIVIGAHFDHLGVGGIGSGSRKIDTVAVHNGADDNASGTAGLIELAHKLRANKHLLKRSVLLVAFDAEEKGILGSKYFINNSPINLSKIVTMINLDMIGRLKDSVFTISGVGTSSIFSSLIDSLDKKSHLKIKKDFSGYGPSDHSSFYAKNIPVLSFFSGFHNDYHLPEDDWEMINSKGEKDILDIVYNAIIFISRIENRPDFLLSGPKEQKTYKGTFKVTLGIIPSYGSVKKGLEVGQISNQNGPAAKAGIKAGDLIKEMNEKKINDIYEYMKRLKEFKKGDQVDVLIDRNSEILTLKVIF